MHATIVKRKQMEYNGYGRGFFSLAKGHQRPPQQIVAPLEHLQGVSMERNYAFSIH